MRIIKKDGHEELFKKEKVYQSIYEAFLNAHHDKKSAATKAKEATKEVLKHLKGKSVVKSDYVFKIIATLLEKHDPDVAFLYETHRDIN